VGVSAAVQASSLLPPVRDRVREISNAQVYLFLSTGNKFALVIELVGVAGLRRIRTVRQIVFQRPLVFPFPLEASRAIRLVRIVAVLAKVYGISFPFSEG